MAHAQVSDGRAARSARTRAAVVDAMLALIADGDLRPTARRIAERAGVSLRSVYVHFDDLEDLFLAAAERQIVHVGQAIGELHATGTLDERIRAFVEYRVAVLETTGNVRRAAALQEPFSKTLSSLHRYARQREAEVLATVFAEEIAALPPDVREGRVLALEALCSGAGYDRLRVAADRTPDQIVGVLVDAARVLLRGAT